MSELVDRLLGLWDGPLDDGAEEAFRQVYADPVTVNGVSMTAAQLVERARTVQHTYSGRTTEVVDEVVTPDRVVVGFRMRGRHTGPLETPLGTVHPTGRQVVIRVADILTVENGLITDIWMVADELGALTQLGAVRLV
jgi:predicted ester cyclase